MYLAKSIAFNNHKLTEIIKYVDALLNLNEELKVSKLQANAEQLKQRIANSEERINQLIYELYELTPEEIQVVEGGVHES